MLLFSVTCCLVSFQRVVGFAPALGLATTPSRLHVSAPEKGREPLDKFSEELEWAEQGELQAMPNDKWLSHDLNNVEHHEWFSEGVEPKANKAVPNIDSEDLKKNHQHEWFAEEIEWMEKPEPFVKPNDLHKGEHHELFSEAVAPSKETVTVPVAKKEDLQSDHEHEWFTYQLHWFPRKTIAPLEHHDWFQDALEMFPPTKVPQAAPVLDRRSVIGSEWFTDAMASSAPVKPQQAAAFGVTRTHCNEWFSSALDEFVPVQKSSLPKMAGSTRGAEWFSNALHDFTASASSKQVTHPRKVQGKQDLGHGEWFSDALFD